MNRFVCGRARKVTLFHGTPLKKLMFDDPARAHERQIYPLLRPFRPLLVPLIDDFHLYTSASQEGSERLRSAFRVSSKRIRVTGHPRTDVFYPQWKHPLSEESYLDIVRNRVLFDHVVTYLPTYRAYRKGGNDLLEQYGFDFATMEEVLEELNAILIMKHHFGLTRIKSSDVCGERIYFPSDEEIPDIYPLLKSTDVLITDYSSVYFDFLLLDRPVIFAPFDRESYIQRDSGFYYEYDEVTPGPKARTWREVIPLLKEAVVNPSKYQEERQRVVQRFNTYLDGKSSQRCYEAISEILGLDGETDSVVRE